MILRQIFCTKLGWLGISLFFLVVFGVLTNWFEWAYIGCYASLIYPVVLGIIMFIYAFFINPFRKQ